MALSPLGPVASSFFRDNHEIAAIMGPVGSAKSTASGLRIVRHALEQAPHNGIRYSRFAIVRNTGPQLNDTTIKTWLGLFPENVYGKFSATSKTHRWRFRPQGSEYLIDAEFMFRALDDEDDVSKLLSFDVTGMWFNELREINPAIIAQAGRRCGRYPGAALGGCTWHGWIGDTNPWAATSDFHEMFVSNPRVGYQFFKQPGGMDEGAENLANLAQTPQTLELPWNDPRRQEQGRSYYVDALRDYSKTDGDMYVHCKYGAERTGKPVYTSYDDNAHCKKFELLSDGKFVPVLIGYDNTGRHPAALISQRTAAGQWRVRFEFCAAGMGMVEHARELKRFLTEKIPNFRIVKITCDPAGKAKDSNELDMRMVVAREFPGVSVVNARTNDVETRVEAVDGAMRRLVNGEPAIIIHPDCKILRSACINKYRYRKLKIAGEERYTETPEKVTPYGDIADALQYLLLGGGEGRLNSGGDPAKEVRWPEDGASIVIGNPEPRGQKEMRDSAMLMGMGQELRRPRNPFDMNKPRGWNPLGVKD